MQHADLSPLVHVGLAGTDVRPNDDSPFGMIEATKVNHAGAGFW